MKNFFAGFAMIALYLSPVAHAGKIIVHPGDNLQRIIDSAALKKPKPKIEFAPGTYFPQKPGFALIALSARHNGIHLEGNGHAELRATNPKIADQENFSYPAIVSHIFYLGDGLTNETVIGGFTLSGAKGYLSKLGEEKAEPNKSLERKIIFYTDGGAVKIFGNSSPRLERLTIENNASIYCAGGVSVEQMGKSAFPVVFKEITWRNNSALATGAALDLLPGSRAIVTNSKFVANEANKQWVSPEDIRRARKQIMPHWNPSTESIDGKIFKDSSAVTVFAGSVIEIENTVFDGNSGGIDFNPEVSWYWEGKSQPSPASPSKLRGLRFTGNRLHSIKIPKEWQEQIIRE